MFLKALYDLLGGFCLFQGLVFPLDCAQYKPGTQDTPLAVHNGPDHLPVLLLNLRGSKIDLGQEIIDDFIWAICFRRQGW